MKAKPLKLNIFNKISTPTKIYATLSFTLCLWLVLKWRLYNNFSPFEYIGLLLTPLLCILFMEGLARSIRNSLFKAFLLSGIIALSYLAGKYHFRVKTSFDYVVLVDNFFEIFNKESLGVISGTMKKKDFLHGLIIFLGLPLLSLRFKNLLRTEVKPKFGLALLACYFLLINTLPYQRDEVSYVLKSVIDFHLKGPPVTKEYAKFEENNPFTKLLAFEDKAEQKNIIIVNIESFNGLYVNKKTEKGHEITPVFNSLIKDGLFVEDFYGNSVQTIKGQFSLLCSKLPLMRGKASYKVDGERLNCMPRVFKKLGYQTYFHKCFSNLNFDNTQNFMKAIGFDDVRTTDQSFLSEQEKERKSWGWGIQDDVSYIDFVKNLKEKSQKGPVFATIHTVSHHMKFDKLPPRHQVLYPRSKDKREQFLNSQHTSDKFLKTLIDELKSQKMYDNSIIIITGDHSYPAGEHGLFDNQTGYYQEFFKTPFLMIGASEVPKKVVRERTHSHIDIFPTVLDMLKIGGEFNFLGRSILEGAKGYAHLIQPYNGMSLSVVNWPYKYVWNRKKNKEFLYNLKDDPNEEVKIVNESLFSNFRKQRDLIIFNDHYVRAL